MNRLTIKEINFENKPRFRFEFLRKFFELGQPATYDAKTGDLTCEAGKRRSFDDLYDLIKYYYPITSKKGLIRAINKAGLTIDIRGFFCDTQENVVFFRNSMNKEFNKKIFSSTRYNSDEEHRKKESSKKISINKLEEWMKI